MKLQPSGRDCFVCGVENRFGLHIRFYDEAPGQVSAKINLPEAYQSYPGVVHGGIVAGMLDEAASRTVFTTERFVVTAKMEVRYRKPVPLKTSLRLEGRLLEDRGKVCKALGRVLSEDGVLLAEAEVTLVEVAPDYLAAMTPLDQQGWKVYPEEEQ